MFRRIALSCLLALAGAAALPAGAQDAAAPPAAADRSAPAEVAPPAVAPPASPAPAPAPAAPATSAGSPSAIQVAGLWCGAGPLHEFSLRLTQREQDVEGELARRGRVRTIEGRIDGNVLRTQATKIGALVLEKRGDELKVTSGDGPLALVRGQSFRRSSNGDCAGASAS